jgi:hypothetical protein
MTADRVRKKAPRKARGSISVDEEQRRRLVEDCAFFRAGQYRDVVPGQIRQEDVRVVEALIDAVLAPRPARRRKRGS